MTSHYMERANATHRRVATADGAPRMLVRLGRALWLALEEHGRRKAMRTLHELADRREATAPDVARQLRSACHWLADGDRPERRAA